MARLGKDFEEMVARIEAGLATLGAIVTSPDYITDKVTGRKREVDASIRHSIGSAPILVTIECRDRTKVQDITWLEQIKSKKDSVGANQTIVVSREGFTEPAIEYANHHGLVLRQLSEVTDELILRALEAIEVHCNILDYGIENYRFKFYREKEDEELRINQADEVNTLINQKKPFASGPNGQPLTLWGLFNQGFSKKIDEIFTKLEEQKLNETIIVFTANYPPNMVMTQTTQGQLFIEAIQFLVKCSIQNRKMPSLEPIQYTDESGNVIESFSHTTDPEIGTTVTVKFDVIEVNDE